MKYKPNKMTAITAKKLFEALYSCPNEKAVDNLFSLNKDVFRPDNWFPLGGNFSNYGVIENQQSSPIAALIEKLTNSIDAILMRKCIEAGIEPKSKEAPQSMEAAVKKFFKDSASWDLP